jgi:hypothetical protein
MIQLAINKTKWHGIICLSTILLNCADDPIHSNVYEPKMPNTSSSVVELKTELITDLTNHSMKIDWTELGDEDFFCYNIYRSLEAGVDTFDSLIGIHPYPFLNSDLDSGLHPNTSHYYKIFTEDKG